MAHARSVHPTPTSIPTQPSPGPPSAARRRRVGAALVLLASALLLAVMAPAAHGWATTHHKTMAQDCNATDGRGDRPNSGNNADDLYSGVMEPDDAGLVWSLGQWTLQHGSIGNFAANQAALWYLAAPLEYKWVWVSAWWGGYYELRTDWAARARDYGRGTHFIMDSGQPYHSNLVQSFRADAIANFDRSKAIHSAYEHYVEDNYTSTICNTCAYQTTVRNTARGNPSSAYTAATADAIVAASLLGSIIPIVDRGISGDYGTFTPNAGSDKSNVESYTRQALAAVAASTKGAFVNCTNTLVAPEDEDLMTGLLTLVPTTTAPGGQVRIDDAGQLGGYLAAMLDPEHHEHFQDVLAAVPDTDRVLIANPGAPVSMVNVFFTGSQPIPHPDLVAVTAALEQPCPAVGEPLTLRALLFNAGTATATPMVEVRADGMTLGAQPVPMPGLQPTQLVMPWTPTTPGAHRLEVLVDPAGGVDESSNEQAVPGGSVTVRTHKENNSFSDSVWVGPPPGAPWTVRRVAGGGGGGGRVQAGQVAAVFPAGWSTRTPHVALGEAVPESLGLAPSSGWEYASRIANLGPPGLDMMFGPALEWSVVYSGAPSDLMAFRQDTSQVWTQVPYAPQVLADRVRVQVDGTGLYVLQHWTGAGVGPGTPSGLWLGTPGPTPWTTSTRIAFALPAAGRAVVRVFDVAGREVARPLDTTLSAGAHGVTWDGCDRQGRAVPAGLYLLRLETADGARIARTLRLP